MHRFKLTFLIALGVIGVAPVHAQSSGAEELFQRGIADMRAGNFAAACPQLDASQHREPGPGVLFASAECYGKWSKPLAALRRYESYVALLPSLSNEQRARHEDRRKLAVEAIQRLSPAVPRLNLVVTSAALEVVLDDVPLSPDSLAEPVPVEVGAHHIEGRHDGIVRWSTDLTLAPGEIRRLEIAPAPLPHEPEPRLESTRPAGMGAKAPAHESPPASSAWVTAGWVAGAVGAASVVTGAGFGVAVLHQKGVVSDECGGEADAMGSIPCSAEGYRAVKRGRDFARVSDFSVGGGVLLLAAGAAMLIATDFGAPAPAKTARRPALELDVTGAQLQLSGSW